MPYKMKADERKRNKKYYQENKEHIKATVKKYRDENKEKVTVSQKRYRQENKEKIKDKDAAYYQSNRDQVRKRNNEYTAAHTEENRSRAAKWYKENPEQGKLNAKVSGNKRRARIAVVGGTFTKEDIRNLYVTQGAKCYYCSVSIEEEYHIDHMTPIIRGGSNDVSNLCLTDPKCNMRKHTKTAEEFIRDVG